MHTLRKLPVDKPSKVNTGINKDNFLYYPILSGIASEPMIHQGIKLSNGSGSGDITLVEQSAGRKSREEADVALLMY